MIQDIAPSRLDNAYHPYMPRDKDYLLLFDKDGKILVREEDGSLYFPVVSEMPPSEAVYLFSVDEDRFFLSSDRPEVSAEGFSYRALRDLRSVYGGNALFVAFTAYHLWKWYSDNRYCGRCGEKLGFSQTERALVCPDCGLIRYPRINPAVIVGVIQGDKLLLTRYNRGYAHNALVAGFTEIGETVEETVAREVMEETGIKVKNIRYYKSQPWGIAQDILMGFYCDADGDAKIHVDESELKYAEFVRREDIVLQPDHQSLTNEMMMRFKEGKEC
ncbi:MAG: NAD(+) diphosphatase [Firmicutes bacterium]|nr:NAD(+) diphosphatase [Bacillota bacterium]